MNKEIKIIYFHRKRDNSMWSIEKLFEVIRIKLKLEFQLEVCEMPNISRGIWPRLKNIRWANKQQSTINHITGDIHYIALGLKKKKTILTIHDLGFMDQYHGLSRFILWLFWIYIPVRRVRYVVAISEATRADIMRYARCKPDKIKLIPNFISSKIKAEHKEFNAIQPVILQVGTKFNKNLERLILALKGIHCKLLIIGYLSVEQLCLLHANQIVFENRFNLTDNEIIKVYCESDVLCFCSLLEGFGLPILEAQTTGRPVITSNLSSMPEVAGGSACLIDPYSIESMRVGILKVINNPEYRGWLVKKGFENVKRFSLDTVTLQYAALYEEVYWLSQKK